MSADTAPAGLAVQYEPEDAQPIWPAVTPEPADSAAAPGRLLTPAYCAERAAAALTKAESAAALQVGDYLAIAGQWRELGQTMAINFGMIRTADRSERRR